MEFNICPLEFRLKLKKTLTGKVTFSKLNEFHTALQANPKKNAKREFE